MNVYTKTTPKCTSINYNIFLLNEIRKNKEFTRERLYTRLLSRFFSQSYNLLLLLWLLLQWKDLLWKLDVGYKSKDSMTKSFYTWSLGFLLIFIARYSYFHSSRWTSHFYAMCVHLLCCHNNHGIKSYFPCSHFKIFLNL